MKSVCCCCTFRHQCVIRTQHIQREMFFDEDTASFVEHQEYFVFGIQINKGLKCIPMIDIRGIDGVVGLHDNTGDLL